jgi:hypothetical protein
MVWAQPDVQDWWWKWEPGTRATFWKVLQAEQTWVLTVEPDGWLTQLQAATLLGVETIRIYEWVRDDRIEHTVAPDGVVVVSLRSVAQIFAYRASRGRGPGFPPGTFR